MNSKHNNRKNMLSIVFLLAIMLIIPFSSSMSEDIKPDKIKINHNIKENKNVYENEYISITSDLDNTIDISKAILQDKYISIPEYDKKKSSSNYELKFYTGNDGVTYDIYKSDLTGVSKKKVKETGYLYTKVTSKDNYITIQTSGFSSLIATMPDLIIPYNNKVIINLNQYLEGYDHYEVLYFNMTNDGLRIEEGETTNLGQDFELTLLNETIGGYNQLQIETYENYINDSSSHLNSISVYACGNLACDSGNVVETFTISTPSPYTYYYLGVGARQGLHEDMKDYFDFNNNINHPDQFEPFTYSRFDVSTQYDNFPNVWSGIIGINGGAFDFDGVDDYINLSGFTTDLNTFSVSLWINYNSISSLKYAFETYDGSKRLLIGLDSSSNIAYLDGSTWNTLVTSPSTSTWYHIVITGDNSGTIGYVNGNSVTSAGVTSRIGDTTSLGSNRQMNGAWTDAIIDEVGFFNKKLSVAEINYLYNSGNSRDFFTLNNPEHLGGGGPCFDDTLSQCWKPDEDTWFGELQTGNTDVYLDNYFNFDEDGYYTYHVQYYDYILDSFQELTHGEAYLGTYYDLALNSEDKLTINFKENDEERGFYALINATAVNGYDNQQIYMSVDLPIETPFPPNEIKPISIDWNTATGFDLNIENVSLNLNSYYGNWSDLNVKYYDENLGDNVSYYISLDNNITSNIIVSETGNLSVKLDATQVSNNIILEIDSVGDKLYSGTFEVNVSNALGSIYRTFTIISGEASEIVDLKKATISNQSVVYNEMVCIDTDDYFYNVSKVSVLFEYENVSYNQTQLYNFGLVGPPTAITNETTGFIAYTTELAVFCFEAKEINLSQYITMIVYDNLSNSAQQNFYINVVASIPMTEAQTYLANFGSLISGLFPDASSLSTLESLSIVIGVILIVSILILVMTFKQFGVTSIYITLGVDILLFLLFAGLNYISTGFLVLIALLLIGLSYLKIRSS